MTDGWNSVATSTVSAESPEEQSEDTESSINFGIFSSASSPLLPASETDWKSKIIDIKMNFILHNSEVQPYQ